MNFKIKTVTYNRIDKANQRHTFSIEILYKQQMQKESATENYLKKKHISYIGGPILFTAPHSKRLNRGGPKFNQQIRIHEKQLHTAWLVSKFAQLTTLKKGEPNSFVSWGKSSAIDQKDMDPNYLLKSMWADSPFHQSLHFWALKHSKVPILHVDVHGKLNRKNNCEVDVGIRSMEVHWQNDPLINSFKPYFEGKMSKIFEGHKFKQFDCFFNTDPNLHGYWGGGMMTMTEQAIILGIPSLQLEIPMEVRKALFKKEDLMIKFAEGIKQFYLQVIVPYYEKKSQPLKISKQIAMKFVPTVKSSKQLTLAIEQISQMQRKLALDANAKKI